MGEKKISIVELIENCEVMSATPEEAHVIIKYRIPLGKFYTVENDSYVGIDNEYGHAWTEEFDDLTSCVKWLMGEEE